ncbi:MAG: hypothetical protein ACKVVP_23315 [Chloroflexota bacterium]
MIEMTPEQVMRAAHVVASAVAQWGDRFEAYELGRRDGAHSGPLRGSPAARERTVNQVWEWLTSLSDQPWLLAFNIYLGNDILLDQYDGMPGILVLTREKFALVQTALQSQGFSADCYYPASEQYQVIEPQQRHGGIVLVEERYTPAQWARRDEPMVPLIVPTDLERRRRFIEET